ncbi:hypothetical protein JCM19037_513 [Geomicrobium sp. JCM 19037]|uniref:XkdX family protein n=1 Tax=Geomicrobium sp. JCM 19037 TaxID=1460634 RepID=UPI00045F33BE|nr:XkdX family protein [Geomicrobium sp. JCM 19037]GAK02287.1 hypothetical protein JCM19037_513 [Geomicrobium sp. JCM 19037]
MGFMYETLKERYAKNWCRIDQLAQFVALGALTADGFESITEQSFEEYMSA